MDNDNNKASISKEKKINDKWNKLIKLEYERISKKFNIKKSKHIK